MMLRENTRRWAFVILVSAIATCGLTLTHVDAQSPARDGKADFQKMIEYLARDGGRWRAPNPRHQPDNDQSPDAVGLWFDAAAQGHVLELTVVFHYGDDVRRSTRGYWLWHPGRKEIVYHEVSPNGAVRTGVSHFEDANTFINLTDAFSPSGDVSSNRGVNVFTDDDTHDTTAYAKGPDGEWVEQMSLTWARTDAQGAQP